MLTWTIQGPLPTSGSLVSSLSSPLPHKRHHQWLWGLGRAPLWRGTILPTPEPFWSSSIPRGRFAGSTATVLVNSIPGKVSAVAGIGFYQGCQTPFSGGGGGVCFWVYCLWVLSPNVQPWMDCVPVGVFKVGEEHGFYFRWSLGLELQCARWVESGAQDPQGPGDDNTQPSGRVTE